MGGGALDPDTSEQLRALTPRVLGAVARRSADFAAAEDAVQDALLAAALDWPERGVPKNPAGWLFHVACRRYADQRDAERARREREVRAAAQAAATAPEPAIEFTADDGDDTLVLLFTCCHPALTPSSAIALTLRAVAGLTTAEIARAFLVPEATMAQRISRAKQTIAEAGGRFAEPVAGERATRTDQVLRVLYLMFNEGHTASHGAQLARGDLCCEALRLARTVHRLQPDHTEAQGLLALMLLTEARRPARATDDGALVPLHEQDRMRWDRGAIAEGSALLAAALPKGRVGSYQIQAAIAALHAEAPTFAATDWPQILALYGLLQRVADSPMVTLNRAIALAMVRGPAAGLELLATLDGDRHLGEHFRLDAARGHLHERAGDGAAAQRHYRAAAERAGNDAERRYLLDKAAALATEEHR